MLSLLLKDIRRDKSDFDVKIIIFDDCSDEIYDLDEFSDLDIDFTREEKNHGKTEYWKLYNKGLRYINNTKNYDYYFKLDDDVRLKKDFFSESINIWENIDDQNKISLFPLLDNREGKKVWTNHEPIIKEFGGIKVSDTK